MCLGERPLVGRLQASGLGGVRGPGFRVGRDPEWGGMRGSWFDFRSTKLMCDIP